MACLLNKEAFRFKLVSYNVLSQTLLCQHDHLYKLCQSINLSWPDRGYRILKKILSCKADIICLQEIEEQHLESFFSPSLKQSGYDYLYKQKTGMRLDGCAIFYKPERFHLRAHNSVEFNRKHLNKLLDKDNVGIIASFEPKCQIPNSRLVIGNTHLIYNPKAHMIRLAQMQLFIKELDQMSRNENLDSRIDKYHPTILCGDLNSPFESATCRYILKEKPDKKSLQSRNSNCQIESNQQSSKQDATTAQQEIDLESTNPFSFKNAHPKKNCHDEPFVSSFSHLCVVDHIFYSHDSVKLKSINSLPTFIEFQETIGPIPNADNPSDHLSLEAEFEIEFEDQ